MQNKVDHFREIESNRIEYIQIGMYVHNYELTCV